MAYSKQTDKAHSNGTFSSTSAGNNSSSKTKSKIWKRSSSLKRSLGQLSKEISIFNSGDKEESDDSVWNEFWFFPKNYVFHSI